MSLTVVAYESDGSTELFDFDYSAGYRVTEVAPIGREFRVKTVDFEDVPDEFPLVSVAGAGTLAVRLNCVSATAGGAAALIGNVVDAVADPTLRAWVLKVTYDNGRVEAWDVLRPADVQIADYLPSELRGSVIRATVLCRVGYSPTVTGP